MKRFTQPSRLVAAACAALVLTACGGGDEGNLYLAGSITGLTKEGLVLENRSNGDTKAIPAFSNSFMMDRFVSSDDHFDIQIKTQPAGAVCTAAFNSGRTGQFPIQSIEIRCVTNSYQLGGTISGLSNAGLVLINGADKLNVAAGASTFVMPARVPDGSPYGIVIFAQPANQNCAITSGNGTGNMGSSDKLNAVHITCN